MNLIPYHDKLVVKPAETRTIIVSSTGNKQEYGEVLAVGSELKDFINVGETVFFESWAVQKTPAINGEEHYFVPKDVILGKYEGKID